MPPLQLTPGSQQPSLSNVQVEEQIQTIRDTVEHYLPEFAASIQNVASGHIGAQLILNQDAFAAGYHHDEYTLLAFAVKYAGLYGVPLLFVPHANEVSSAAKPRRGRRR